MITLSKRWDSSMARDQLTIVLDVLISLDGRCCQITYHGDQRSNCTDQGILCHFSLCGRCIDYSKKRRSHNTAYCSSIDFLGLKTGAILCLPMSIPTQ